MHEVHFDLLWIGHMLDIRERESLFDIGVTNVIDVAYEEKPAQLPRQLVYCRFPLNDGAGNEPSVVLQALRTACDFLKFKSKTLIACSAGMSRSPTIAAFSLAHHLKVMPEEVIERIGDKKSLELNPDFWLEVKMAFEQL